MSMRFDAAGTGSLFRDCSLILVFFPGAVGRARCGWCRRCGLFEPPPRDDGDPCGNPERGPLGITKRPSMIIFVPGLHHGAAIAMMGERLREHGPIPDPPVLSSGAALNCPPSSRSSGGSLLSRGSF
jgi:hypothetical protein